MRRTESQKPMKCVPFAVNICICEMLFLTCTDTLQPHRQYLKLKIMIINIKTKVVNNFGASEMIDVELRAKKL